MNPPPIWKMPIWHMPIWKMPIWHIPNMEDANMAHPNMLDANVAPLSSPDAMFVDNIPKKIGKSERSSEMGLYPTKCTEH